MTAENRKSSNTEWLIEKLRAAERERDEVIEHARGLEIDNLRLRMKLEAISSIVGDEVYVGRICEYNRREQCCNYCRMR